MLNMESQKRVLLKSLENNKICIRENCSDEENKEYSELFNDYKLPLEVFIDENYTENHFYKISKSDLTDDEIKILIALKQSDNIKTIKNCLVYFVVISVLSIIAGIIIFASSH